MANSEMLELARLMERYGYHPDEHERGIIIDVLRGASERWDAATAYGPMPPPSPQADLFGGQ